MSKHLLAAAVLAAALTTAAAPASAATFSGRCTGAGTIRTGVPLKLAPAITSISFTSTGTCTGLLDGRPVQDAAYRGLSVASTALLSCLGGQASGDTSLSIEGAPDQWTTLALRFDDANVLGTSVFALRGTAGGIGWGQHQLTPDLALLAACAGGGANDIGNTVSLATVTPFEG